MLAQADIDALIDARHRDPFSVLGMHTDGNGKLWLCTLVPDAAEIILLDAASRKAVAHLARCHPAGLFEICIAGRAEAFAYRLQVRWNSGEVGVYADPYSFPPEICDADLHLLSAGKHLRPFEVLGAHLRDQLSGGQRVTGVRFAVWAPNAQRVSVVGEFNCWDGRRHPMRCRGASGIWELFIPGVQAGDLYKLELLDHAGDLLPLKADPYARAAQIRPDSASIVTPLLPRKPPAPSLAARNSRAAAISIYEVHAASWRREQQAFPDWDGLADLLPAYVADLGFTHIELMPVSEHPFDGSWGYQALGLYAPTSRFGSQEAFVRFVEACNKHNLGVLLDWVPAHFPADAHGLACFDGTCLFEYADPREGFHRDWNTLIYNFGRNEVRNFLSGSALYWIERFGVDGLRVDAVASMLYRDYSRPEGDWVPNILGGKENLEAISLLKFVNEMIGANCRDAVTMAEESTTFPGVSATVASGGLGFNFKWNMGWMNDTLSYMKEEPIHRRWHHDKMTFGLVYAFSENFVLPISHDEVVHGKRAMLQKMPGDEWQQFANLRAYYGFMWGHPGKKLLFMGQEFAQRAEWNHEAGLDWPAACKPFHAGVRNLVRDLNTLYKSRSALHKLDCDAGGFAWIVSDDAENAVFAWLRRDGQGSQMLVVCNFTPVPRRDYRLGLPGEVTACTEVLNTDAAAYGGGGMSSEATGTVLQPVCAHGFDQSILLVLAPLATLFIELH
ncbi:MAG: 1,4-alpha-glucan branching protein GlgB [Betaproteobacteria bacterium]